MQTAVGFYPTTTQPSIIVENPSNLTINGQTVSLNFTINYTVTQLETMDWNNVISWIGYSIDNQPFITLLRQTDSSFINKDWTTLTLASLSSILLNASDLQDGQHSIVVQAEFNYLIEQVNAGRYNYTFAPINFTTDSTLPMIIIVTVSPELSPSPTMVPTSTPNPTNTPSPNPSPTPSPTASSSPTLQPSPTLPEYSLGWIPIAVIALVVVSIGILFYALGKVKDRET
jgi:hypothetical protein